MIQTKPTLRWGILGTGWVSEKFVKDLILPRSDAVATHIVHAIGTSSVSKGEAFVNSTFNDLEVHGKPRIYEDYKNVYDDELVDVVYVGIPHALHKEACLAAIHAGKHILCEKPMCINEKDAQEVIAAAREKRVFLMEAVWTRFFPLVKDLQKLLYEEEVIGEVRRMFCDFSMDMKMETLDKHSRLKDPKLGAGALLDLGIYPLTLSNLFLDTGVGKESSNPEVSSHLKVVDGIDYADSIILKYPKTQRMAILTASVEYQMSEEFCRIEGSNGNMVLSGPAASKPTSVKITSQGTERTILYEDPGMGFFYEADAVALDIQAGRLENTTMPLAEMIRMLRTMDDIRRKAGVIYPQDL
ncbi:NAD(P)-binding protein [Saccharata proteae CBS 121410]|uniref:D-xylose 1-dehydrogenase (NADP(+), D-xylono-1,5-lactone-forming) n=1 Tax=Saccharata proteae CBS 121410 TaxID=1314787 RepID=A0A9P4LWE4_9PEZI|nr:NAD(P)-binding protein [Saccharata proteae CBS 121410]